MAADYFPLEPGLTLEYSYRDPETTDGRRRFEVLLVERLPGATVASCRRTTYKSGKTPAQVRLQMTQDLKRGWLIDSLGGKEFPLPPAAGQVWSEPPERCEVASLSAVKRVPAGEFASCLKIVRLAAGGDAGYEERIYAPGIGLIYAGSRVEGDEYELELLSR